MNKQPRIILQERDAAGTLSQTAVSHIGFSVPDVEATADFYGRVLGLIVHEDLPTGGLRLGWGTGHHVMDLVAGDPGLSHYGFEVRDHRGIDGIAERLTAAGHLVEKLHASFIDSALGTPTGLAVQDPDGTAVHFHSAVERQGESAADTGRRPIKFQHTTLGTADVERMAAFFVDTVGFRISDQLDDGRF